jgi:tetratricopeptide (TPR) repeat protein
MKLLATCITVLFCTSGVFAKTTTYKDSVTGIVDRTAALISIDKGKQLIIDNKVREALLSFREAAMKDPYTWKAPFWISYCHYKLKNYGYARQYALEAIAKGKEDVEPEVYDILGSAYHRLGLLDSAEINYNKAIALMPKARLKDLNVSLKLASCQYAKANLDTTKSLLTPLLGDVTTGYNEYRFMLTKDGKKAYFTGRRPNTTGGRMNPDDEEYFEDIYSCVWNPALNKFDSVTNKIERLNTAGFESFNWISPDGLRAVITFNNTATSDKKQTKSSDLYEVEFTKKGKWNTPKPIASKSVNSGFFDGAATLTADGNTMYFVSDRKAEKRSTDIYVVTRQGKSWGEAKPVGDSINTPMGETTPFITPDGRFLFFSSEGHNGFGGFDVFVCENTGSGWGSPINLGSQVNTVNDDVHFVIYKDLAKAYVGNINISGQKSNYDIFEIDYTSLILPIKL